MLSPHYTLIPGCSGPITGFDRTGRHGQPQTPGSPGNEASGPPALSTKATRAVIAGQGGLNVTAARLSEHAR